MFDRATALGFANSRDKWRTQSSTPDPAAYDAYLQARLDLSGWADAPVQKALQGFQTAIDKDPNFGNAYAGLADAYITLAEHGAAPREASYRKAKDAAVKALQLAPGSAEAHAVLGQIALRQDWNFEVAERELRRAVELNPGGATFHLQMAVLLYYQGRFEEGLHEVDLARGADPHWTPVYRTESLLMHRSGQVARAIKAINKVTEQMPNWPSAYDQRAWLYWHVGRYADAIADWRHMAELENDTARVQLEDEGLKALTRGGIVAYARVRLKAIEGGRSYRHAETDFVPAEWYSIAGDHDKALADIEQMVARHDADALQLAVNPALSPLHNYPRFRAALTRVGLNPPPLPPSTQSAESSATGSNFRADSGVRQGRIASRAAVRETQARTVVDRTQ